MQWLIEVEGKDFEIDLTRNPSGYRAVVGGQTFEVDFSQVGTSLFSVIVNNKSYAFFVEEHERRYDITFGGALFRAYPKGEKEAFATTSAPAAGGTIRSFMPCKIVRVIVSEGDRVKRGDELMVVEAMKMETHILADRDGVVERLYVKPKDTVKGNAELVTISGN